MANHILELLLIFLVQHSKTAPKAEIKVWGCADLSKFCTRTSLMQKKAGLENYRNKFFDIELIDIDPDIIARDREKRMNADFVDINTFETATGEKFCKYFTPLNDGKSRLLQGETPYDQIKHYTINNDLLTNVKLRVGDISPSHFEQIKTPLETP